MTLQIANHCDVQQCHEDIRRRGTWRTVGHDAKRYLGLSLAIVGIEIDSILLRIYLRPS